MFLTVMDVFAMRNPWESLTSPTIVAFVVWDSAVGPRAVRRPTSRKDETEYLNMVNPSLRSS